MHPLQPNLNAMRAQLDDYMSRFPHMTDDEMDSELEEFGVMMVAYHALRRRIIQEGGNKPNEASIPVQERLT